MSIKGTAIKFGVFALVLLAFTALIFVVFGQFRFNRTNHYSAIFTNSSGLHDDQFVRAAGVEVGKVTGVTVIDNAGGRCGKTVKPDGSCVKVDFTVEKDVPLYQKSTAAVRYLDLIGNRFMQLERGDSNEVQPPGSTIGVDRTEPALDLDALVGGFRPLFRTLEPAKVNAIAQSLVTVFQGEGGTISDVLDQTAQLTQSMADQDQAVGEVIKNLNLVLATTVKHQQQFGATLSNVQKLVTGLKNHADPLADSLASISAASGSLSDLLEQNRPVIKPTVSKLETTLQPLVDGKDKMDDTLTRVPEALNLLGRAGGIYGDFFNFYLCDISLRVNGLQPGGPVRTVKLTGQPSGRCTPK